MKKLLRFALLICATCLFAVEKPMQILEGKVVRVADGDTITVLLEGNVQERIRFYGIDAPESHQDFGQKAKQFLSNLVFGKSVQVKYQNRDQYGRIVGTVYIGEENINLSMVKAGLAWHYVHFARNAVEYAEAEKEAREKGLGLWAGKDPMPPWDFRRASRRKKGK